ncbi:MAG: NifU family protein [Alphaproteobacteria bacterium]|nr:NifU family protein [Alphaproteobacteria bacterium]
MIIETQNTPDINVMNFFPPEKLLKSGSAEFVDAKSLRKSPLAEKIFDFGGIVSVFITSDMLSVTKESEAQWDDLKPQILAEIMDYLSTGEDIVIPAAENPAEDEVVKQIQGLINARIRPALKQDGGDIAFRKFESGIVYVELQGNCSGCPYAAVTLKEGVEKILKTYIPQVKAVKNFDKGE